jgi:hypothetical protein
LLVIKWFQHFRFERKALTQDEPVFISPDIALKLEWAKRLGEAIKVSVSHMSHPVFR